MSARDYLENGCVANKELAEHMSDQFDLDRMTENDVKTCVCAYNRIVAVRTILERAEFDLENVPRESPLYQRSQAELRRFTLSLGDAVEKYETLCKRFRYDPRDKGKERIK